MMYSEVSITGATGFVGTHLIHQLIIDGHRDIKIISRGKGKDNQRIDANAVKLVIVDLAQEYSIKKIADTKLLIHLAYSRSNFEENIKIANNIIKAAHQGHIQRIIHCSTAVVSGFSTKRLITEETPPHPKPGYRKK